MVKTTPSASTVRNSVFGYPFLTHLVCGSDKYVYKKLFRNFFKIIGKLSGQDVLWQHIHGRGLHGVIMDMDQGQVHGKY